MPMDTPTVPPPNRHVWDMNPNIDSPSSYPFFRAYLMARKGTRKLGVIRHAVWDRGARETAPSWSEINTWFIQGKWAERALAYDAHIAAIHDEARMRLEQQTAEEDTLHIRSVLNLQRAVNEQEWEKIAAISAGVPDQVDIPRSLIASTDSNVKNTRLVNGESTEKVENIGANLSTDDLAAIIEIFEKGKT